MGCCGMFPPMGTCGSILKRLCLGHQKEEKNVHFSILSNFNSPLVTYLFHTTMQVVAKICHFLRYLGSLSQFEVFLHTN